MFWKKFFKARKVALKEYRHHSSIFYFLRMSQNIQSIKDIIFFNFMKCFLREKENWVFISLCHFYQVSRKKFFLDFKKLFKY